MADPLEAVPFAVSIGVELVSAEAGEVVGRLPWAPERCSGLDVGRSFVVVETDLEHEGRLAARVTQTQAVLTREGG